MTGLKIHLSNGTFVGVPGANVALVTGWFAKAAPHEVLHLDFPDVGKGVHIQKRYIVQIETEESA